jgi:hypothetical protein
LPSINGWQGLLASDGSARAVEAPGFYLAPFYFLVRLLGIDSNRSDVDAGVGKRAFVDCLGKCLPIEVTVRLSGRMRSA